MTTKQVHVAAGVIVRQQQVFITLRDDKLHQGGKWEFPGGKVESGETVIEALTRELQEEIGIKVTKAEPLTLVEHDYGDKKVKLDFWKVTEFDNEPFGKEGQQGRWVEIGELGNYEFPEANKAVLTHIE